MFVIGEVAVDDKVAEARFCCDLEACRGACCCIEGGRGAPIEDDEAVEIEKAYPHVRHLLSRRSIDTIERSGLYEGRRGDLATTCIEERECVFAFVEHGITRCSFEQAYLEGRTDWRKPVSCHLFPIRIRSFGKDHVRYEEINECSAGRTQGAVRNVRLHDFLKEPLVRKYGETWYNRFLGYCSTRNTVHD
jgi:hypothetical protein